MSVRFSIGGDGKVMRSTGTGVPPVGACVASVISTIEFPRPKGGAVVVVDYPLTFQPAPAAPAP